MKRIGIALGGGGAKGFCHIEFLRAIEELGYQPSVISGTSIGAVIGGMYASGLSPDDIQRVINDLKLFEIGKMVDLSIFSLSGLIKGKSLEQFFLKTLPVNDFSQTRIPLKIVATDFWKREEVVMERGPLITAMRASMSLPGIFEPVVADGRVLVDGGCVNPVPYDIIRAECDILIAVDVSGTKVPSVPDTPPNMLEGIFTTFQIMQASIVESMMEKHKPDLYVKPELKNVRMLEFYKYDEIKNGVEGDIRQFKEDVRKLMKSFLGIF
ncbi:MAG: patatin-like phospholipase family protein [Brevinematales bacterium]|nr:patatin-like phospholipase family protein [Brevinematales bacterium]